MLLLLFQGAAEVAPHFVAALRRFISPDRSVAVSGAIPAAAWISPARTHSFTSPARAGDTQGTPPMGIIGSFDKQPREILPLDISYADVLGGRTASSIVATVEVPAGMTLVSQQVAGSTLQLYVSGGTTANSYRWTVLTDITIVGRVTRVEDEFDVVVLEVA